jgi:hypothetical protein
MHDAQATEAERLMQSKFSIRGLAGLLLLAAIAVFYDRLFWLPNREELGWRSARVEFRPVELDASRFAPFQLVGAWKLTSDDTRFGGLSALAIDRDRLLALTDSGILIRFDPPGKRAGLAEIGELPDGPGSGGFKRNRDSEGLLRDPGGRGWWVTFENRHGLWLFDRDFRHALWRLPLGRYGWSHNRGVEGLAADNGGLLLFPETGQTVLRVTGSRVRQMPIEHARGRISDAAAIGPGRWLAIERRLTPLGFRNALVTLEKVGSGYRFGRRIALPVGPVDNVEAIAVEPLAHGKLRLWLMTDDNFQPPLRTLLIALDWSAPPQ